MTGLPELISAAADFIAAISPLLILWIRQRSRTKHDDPPDLHGSNRDPVGGSTHDRSTDGRAENDNRAEPGGRGGAEKHE